MKMETVEHFAGIALVAHLLGHQLLSAQEIEKLIVARSKYQGARSAAPMPLWTPNGTGTDGKDRLGKPVEGERDSGLKASTDSGGKANGFCCPPEWRSAWSGMFSTDEQQELAEMRSWFRQGGTTT
jgi:hypothetical protein